MDKTWRLGFSVVIPGQNGCGNIARPTDLETSMPPQTLFRPSPRQRTAIRTFAREHPAAERPYDRARDLPRLVPLWPNEILDMTPEKHRRLVQRLRRALRDERRRGLAGSWTYDLARHARLYRALQSELALAPQPLSSWATATMRHDCHAERAMHLAEPSEQVPEPSAATLSRAACRAPSSSQAAIGPPRSWVPPSGSRAEAATSPGILPETSCNGSAGDASAT